MHLAATDGASALALISLGSARPVAQSVSRFIAEAKLRNERLLVCPLDSPEWINSALLRGEDEQSARTSIANKCEEVRSLCKGAQFPVCSAPFSLLSEDPKFSEYESAVHALFANDRAFRSDVRNQTFRNLQPILQRLSVSKKNKDTLDAISRFLLQEIALKCFAGNEALAQYEYGFTPQIAALERIYSGRYAFPEHLMVRRLSYIHLPQ